MNMLPDSDVVDPAAPMYVVYVWNGLHDARKIYKSYRDKRDAEITVTALRMHNLDAELVVVGDVSNRVG